MKEALIEAFFLRTQVQRCKQYPHLYLAILN